MSHSFIGKQKQVEPVGELTEEGKTDEVADKSPEPGDAVAGGEEVVVAEEPALDMAVESPYSLKQIAVSIEHLMTHEPKNPYCQACQRAKMQTAPSPNRSKRPSDGPTMPGCGPD